MKQAIVILQFLTYLTLATARRSGPLPAVPTFSRGDVHRLGWGLDEEYIESTETGYEAIKPVKRIVKKSDDDNKKHDKHLQHDEEDEDHHDHPKPLLWGVGHISDLDDVFGLE